MAASIICCTYYSRREPSKLRFGIIKFYDIVSFPVCHVRHMCAASFNSRSLVYGCSTLMHASRYACNEHAEERVKADMRVRDCSRVYGHRVEIAATHSELSRTSGCIEQLYQRGKFGDERGLHPKEMLAQSQNFYRELSTYLSVLFKHSGKKSYVYVTWMAKCCNWLD